jgi:hypothetical protein
MLGPSTGTLRCFKRSEDHVRRGSCVHYVKRGSLKTWKTYWKRRTLEPDRLASNRVGAIDTIRVFFFEKTTCI